MSALVSTCCAAVLDQFLLVTLLVAGTEVHCDQHKFEPLCSFLGLFAPVHAQDAQMKSTAHMVLFFRLLPAEHLLLEQYYIILMLQKDLLPPDSKVTPRQTHFSL
jgi:hypothetical protein